MSIPTPSAYYPSKTEFDSDAEEDYITLTGAKWDCETREVSKVLAGTSDTNAATYGQVCDRVSKDGLDANLDCGGYRLSNIGGISSDDLTLVSSSGNIDVNGSNIVSAGSIVGNSTISLVSPNMTISANGSIIEDVGTPTSSDHATNKEYVDDRVESELTYYSKIIMEDNLDAQNLYKVSDLVDGTTGTQDSCTVAQMETQIATCAKNPLEENLDCDNKNLSSVNLLTAAGISCPSIFSTSGDLSLAAQGTGDITCNNYTVTDVGDGSSSLDVLNKAQIDSLIDSCCKNTMEQDLETAGYTIKCTTGTEILDFEASKSITLNTVDGVDEIVDMTDLDPTALTTAGEYSKGAKIAKFTANGTISAGQLLTYSNSTPDDELRVVAMGTAPASSPYSSESMCIGVATEAATSGDTLDVCKEGIIVVLADSGITEKGNCVTLSQTSGGYARVQSVSGPGVNDLFSPIVGICIAVNTSSVTSFPMEIKLGGYERY